MRCEDFPCCGHTPDDPCERQPYDEPGYYDTSIPGQEHRLCDHENGECDVEYDEEDVEVEDVHYELEYRFDEDQPWTTETHHIEWTDPEAAEAWAAEWRPDVQHRIVKVERTPVQ